MSASVSNYLFNNMGRIGNDFTDNTQTNLFNTRYSNYTLSNFNADILSTSHVKFATQQPNVMFKGLNGGSGVGNMVDSDTKLLYSMENGRSLEKIQLLERPFRTVPYLGRGSCNPSLESQLQQGEIVNDRKSVSTIMENSFSKYSLYPSIDKSDSNNNSNVNDYALNGWVRGGMPTREMPTDKKDK
jgi:hypothetical protein